jgi:hypothetical protein
MTENVKRGLLEAADTLARIAEDLRNGDEISRGVITRKEYIERLYALMVGISILKEKAGGLPYEN